MEINESIPVVKILQDKSFWDIATSVSSIITALFTIGLFFLALFQLRNLILSNTLNTILDLESELYQRKSKIDEISSKIRISGSQSQNNLVLIYSDDLEAAKENYFNALDRLCYCILNGYLSNRDWKSEYNDLLKDTVRENEMSFGIGTYYKILKSFMKNGIND